MKFVKKGNKNSTARYSHGVHIFFYCLKKLVLEY